MTTNNNRYHDDTTNGEALQQNIDKESLPDELFNQQPQPKHQQLLLVMDDNQQQQQEHDLSSKKLGSQEIQNKSGTIEEADAGNININNDCNTDTTAEEQQLETRYQKQIAMKKTVIDQLYKSALDGEDQRRLAVGKHLKVIDDLIAIHGQHLDEIEYQFQQCMKNMFNRYEQHQEEIVTMYESDRSRLLEDIRQLENSTRQESSLEEREQQKGIEEVRSKMAKDMTNLRNIFDNQFEELDERFETTKNEYLQKTELVSESLQKQLLKKEQFSKEMSNASLKIETLRKALKQIRRISIQKSMQNMDRCNHLLARKSQIISRYKGTKTKMEEMYKLHHNKLKELTMAAHEKKMELQDELNRAENVLKMVKLIQKLERQYEELSGDALSNSCDGTDITTIIINRYIRVSMNHKDVQSKEKTLLIQNKKLQKQSDYY